LKAPEEEKSVTQRLIATTAVVVFTASLGAVASANADNPPGPTTALADVVGRIRALPHQPDYALPGNDGASRRWAR
jgi:hypothetical protein